MSKSEYTQLIELISSLSSTKRWLNTKETADYLGYSKDGLMKLKDVHLFLDMHYFKKAGKLIFDRHALDTWIMETKIA